MLANRVRIGSALRGNENLLLGTGNGGFVLYGSDNSNTNRSTIIGEDYCEVNFRYNGNVYNNRDYKTSVDRLRGETYTLSMDIMSYAEYGMYWYPSENLVLPKGFVPNTNGKWERISHTYTQTGANKAGNLHSLFGFHGAIAGAVLRVRKLKLEIGDKATPWRPNKLD